MLGLAAIVGAVQLWLTPPPKPPEPHLILASVTLTGAGKPNGAAPPPTAQFFFPTGTDLILVAATF